MIEEVVVQAGGKGTRMGHYTNNRPKCLISIGGLNILQSIHNAFPEAKLHIIGDYKYDVLDSYLKTVDHGINYSLIKANGFGTNAGLSEAVEEITPGKPVVITWSDLFYTDTIEVPNESINYIGLTNSSICRYKFENNKIIEGNSLENGIMGFFFFRDSRLLKDVPPNGEFVKHLSSSRLEIKPLTIESVIDLGSFESYNENKMKFMNSRFFNNIRIEGERVIKEPKNSKFSYLINDEINWYNFMISVGAESIPKVYNLNPLTIEKIEATHPYLLKKPDKIKVVSKIIDELETLHSLSCIESKEEDMYDVYVNKTLSRIEPVSKYLDLKNKSSLVINGVTLEPILPDDVKTLEYIYKKMKAIEHFTPIHGDPTFSNLFVDREMKVKFIDPRGSFGKEKIYGDPRYDFAKLYYSAVGNYDQFNMKNFSLEIDGNKFQMSIASSGFEETEIIFKNRLESIYPDIKILHALIWLSLSGYFLDDVDAMVASYLHGLVLLRRCIDEVEAL